MGKEIVVPIRYKVKVDVDAWCTEYGLKPSEVRADVKKYFGFEGHGTEGLVGAFPAVEGIVTLVED